MRVTPLFAPLVAFVLSPAVRGDGISGIEVAWYTDRSCNVAPGLEYRNVPCNSCIDPLFYWFSVKLSGLGRNNRVTIHDQGCCAPCGSGARARLPTPATSPTSAIPATPVTPATPNDANV